MIFSLRSQRFCVHSCAAVVIAVLIVTLRESVGRIFSHDPVVVRLTARICVPVRWCSHICVRFTRRCADFRLVTAECGVLAGVNVLHRNVRP
jgi:hypothetical protein